MCVCMHVCMRACVCMCVRSEGESGASGAGDGGAEQHDGVAHGNRPGSGHAHLHVLHAGTGSHDQPRLLGDAIQKEQEKL